MHGFGIKSGPPGHPTTGRRFSDTAVWGFLFSTDFFENVSIFGYTEFFLVYWIYPAKCRKNSTFIGFNISEIFV